MNSKYLSVIIPTLNESNRLPKNLNKIISYFIGIKKIKHIEIIIVDDSEQYKTIYACKRIFEKHNFKNYILIKNKNNEKGKGFCQKIGINKSKGEYILLIDADMSVNINYFSKFENKIKSSNCDLISGKRIGNYKKDSALRIIIGMINKILLNIFLYRTYVPDSNCGFKLLKSYYIKKNIKLYKINTGFFEVELIYKFLENKKKINFIDVKWNNDKETRINLLKSCFVDFQNIFKIKYNL
jgi:glycosyltransferase involved in cell wall biosynthesis